MKTDHAREARKWFEQHGPPRGAAMTAMQAEELCFRAYAAGRQAAEAEHNAVEGAMQEYFEHARRELYPNLKAAAIDITILGDPDPKLCMELGAAILFDKPILVIAPGGRKVPLALRTIAHKIIEHPDPMASPKIKTAITQAVGEMLEMVKFRPEPPKHP